MAGWLAIALLAFAVCLFPDACLLRHLRLRHAAGR